jgi:hypothetical protein
METFLQNRAALGGVLKSADDQALSQRPFGMSLAFIGLLFAVLASGCQSSDLPSKQRELTSQVYGMSRNPPKGLCRLIILSLLFISMSANDEFRLTSYN